MIKKGRIYLGQIQDAWGTPETDLVAGDFLEVNEDVEMSVICENEKNPTINGGYGQNAVILGAKRAECSLPFNVRSFGSTTVPDWCTMAQAAGFDLAESFIDPEYKYILTPTALGTTQVDATIWEYNIGQVTKAGNMVFDWELSGESNKKCMFNMIGGKGVVQALPATGSRPTITKSAAYCPAIVSPTKTILGSATYSLISFSFKGNNTIEQFVDGSTYGYGKSRITNREIDFELQVYAEIPATVNPYTTMDAGSETTITINFGKTGEKIDIDTDSANIQNIERTESGNLVAWTITGVIVDDDLTITVNSDVS